MDLREGTEVVVEGKLIEGKRFDKHTARRVGHADEVEIPLQDAVFAGCAVNGDVGEIKGELSFWSSK